MQFFSYFSVLAIRFVISLEKDREKKQILALLSYLKYCKSEQREKVFASHWIYHVSSLNQELSIEAIVKQSYKFVLLCMGY